MGKKDKKYYEQKVKELRDEKREICSPISEQDYDTVNLDGTRNNNRDIKKIKEDFTRRRRSIKRSEKQQVEKEIQDAINNYKEDGDEDDEK